MKTISVHKSYVPLHGLMLTLQELFDSRCLESIMRETLLTVIIILALILTFVGINKNNVSRYFFMVVLALAASNVIIDCFVTHAASLEPALLFPRSYHLLNNAVMSMGRFVVENYTLVWCSFISFCVFWPFFAVGTHMETVFYYLIAAFKINEVQLVRSILPSSLPLNILSLIAIHAVVYIATYFVLRLIDRFLWSLPYAVIGSNLLCFALHIGKVWDCNYTQILDKSTEYVQQGDLGVVFFLACAGYAVQKLTYLMRKVRKLN